LLDKRDVKRSFANSRLRLEDVIKMEIREAGCKYMDWVHLAQDREKGELL
jgi:hypothetical protein